MLLLSCGLLLLERACVHEGWGPVFRFAPLCTVGADDLLCAAEESMTSAPKSKSGMPSGSGPYRWSAKL